MNFSFQFGASNVPATPSESYASRNYHQTNFPKANFYPSAPSFSSASSLSYERMSPRPSHLPQLGGFSFARKVPEIVAPSFQELDLLKYPTVAADQKSFAYNSIYSSQLPSFPYADQKYFEKRLISSFPEKKFPSEQFHVPLNQYKQIFSLPPLKSMETSEVCKKLATLTLQEGMRHTNPPSSMHAFNLPKENLFPLKEALFTSMYQQQFSHHTIHVPFSVEHYNASLREISRNWSYLAFEKKAFKDKVLISLSPLDKKIAESFVRQFTRGVGVGLLKGMYDSGDRLISFASNILNHPVDTAQEMWRALSFLKTMILEMEGEALTEALAPEILTLIQDWDFLSSKERGQSIGYVLGKYGTDLFIPRALIKTTKCFKD